MLALEIPYWGIAGELFGIMTAIGLLLAASRPGYADECRGYLFIEGMLEDAERLGYDWEYDDAYVPPFTFAADDCRGVIRNHDGYRPSVGCLFLLPLARKVALHLPIRQALSMKPQWKGASPG